MRWYSRKIASRTCFASHAAFLSSSSFRFCLSTRGSLAYALLTRSCTRCISTFFAFATAALFWRSIHLQQETRGGANTW